MMINPEELFACQQRIKVLEKELTEAKLKILNLEQQLFYDADSFSKNSSKVDNSSQYDASDTQECPVREILTAEMLTEAAEQSVSQSSYVYDASMGMYFDHHSRCYYDAERSLYYDPTNGAYYKYNEDTQEYDFHSQASRQDFNAISHIIESKKTNGAPAVKSKRKSKNRMRAEDDRIADGVVCKDFEEGEIVSDDDDDDEETSLGESVAETKDNDLESYIPCIRVVVKSSDHLPVNSMFVVTCKGATIGRDESLKHDILIRDPIISKTHCSIRFDGDVKRYFVQDGGSVQGTFVNGKKMGGARQSSPPRPLYNMDTLQVGQTTMELHIHPRSDTCVTCEPWNLRSASNNDEDEVASSNRTDIEKLRRIQLNKIKKKYGLKNMNYERHPVASKLSTNYKDRSKARRLTKGSDHPTDVDTVHSSSVNRAIPSSNVGHKLLTKMGWKSGQSIGKDQNGILEPIRVEMRADDKAGVGLTTSVDLDNVHKASKIKILLKTKSRYERASQISNVFEPVDEFV